MQTEISRLTAKTSAQSPKKNSESQAVMAPTVPWERIEPRWPWPWVSAASFAWSSGWAPGGW